MYSRILFFVTVGLLVLFSTMGADIQTAFGQLNASHLEGSWKGTLTTSVPGLEPLTSLITFVPGGGVIESRQLYVPTSPLGSFLETPGHGKWVRTGNGKFEVDFVFLLQGSPNNTDANGISLGSNDVRLQLSLNKPGDELTGTFVSTVKDTADNVILTAEGDYQAKPIGTQP